MTTVIYSRYVLVNEEKGIIAWYDNLASAQSAKIVHGGIVYDTDTDDPDTFKASLLKARKNIGVN